MNYSSFIIDFNKMKQELLMRRTSLASNYYVNEDFYFIKKIGDAVVENIWNILVFNINKGYHGLSRQTCTFCIHTDLVGKKCKFCYWSINHKNCKNKKGDYQFLYKYFIDNKLQFITSKEYKQIIEKILKVR